MEMIDVLIYEITKRHKLIDFDEVISITPYGSKVYGTATEKSDLDFVVIHSGTNDELYTSDMIDVHFISLNTFKELLDKHDIMALEVYYWNKQFNPSAKISNLIDFNLDKVKLRKSISAIVNNSWVKAKKKMTLPDENSYIGLKSLFHSFRILDFGIQLATNNKINFSSKNVFWEELKELWNVTQKWDDFYNRYKQKHNHLMSEFKQVAPKDY